MGDETQYFRISTGLKDLIGRDLITDDFVAVFELVKNAFDASATKVSVSFEAETITISDNGKGMSRDDIVNKWLFVAYSAKKDGSEDSDYRDKISENKRVYAGAKGVGRFSCDSLGSTLQLSSKARGQKVQVLNVDWRKYENDPKEEFANIGVQLGEQEQFPTDSKHAATGLGTSLVIHNLRSEWDRQKLIDLRRALSKLINPFSNQGPSFSIEIIAPAEAEADAAIEVLNEIDPENPVGFTVNGVIENSILRIISNRTTVIRVRSVSSGQFLETELEDRGSLVYKIREANPYKLLKDANFVADVYFLNRSAKTIFTKRMGVRSLHFGSIFAFRNGFRVFPIGNEDDDFFGINKRKQQGQRRFLGTRELIGRVDVDGVSGFDEATSRNGGFIRSAKVDELIDAVIEKCIKRLERYVVDISWKDEFDKDQIDTSRMLLDNNSALITQLVSRLAATDGVELLEFNPDLVRIVDEKSDAFISSFKALELLAEETGDKRLLERVETARARIEELQAAEAAARQAERKAEERATLAERAAATARAELFQTEERLADERARNQFLVSAASLDHDTIMNLHHQIGIHAAAVHNSIKVMSRRLRQPTPISNEEIINFLDTVAFRNSQILTASRFASRGGYKEQAVSKIDDLAVFIHDYSDSIANAWAPTGMSVATSGVKEGFERAFKPIEIGIIIDNLTSNAAKFSASQLLLDLQIEKVNGKRHLVIDAYDDGEGWSKKVEPLERVFEKGVTTSSKGSGLGLYHVKQVVEGMGGSIEIIRSNPDRKLDGAQLRIRLPA